MNRVVMGSVRTCDILRGNSVFVLALLHLCVVSLCNPMVVLPSSNRTNRLHWPSFLDSE